MAHSALVKPKKQGKRLRYDYTYYLYGFFQNQEQLDSHAVEVKFGQHRVTAQRAIRLGAENISKVVSRLKDTDISFFNQAGEELLRFTVPAVGTEEFAAECPIRFEQVIETELFYDYIRRFAEPETQK